LIVDARGLLTPSEQVERKLVALLGRAPLPVSHLGAGGALAWLPPGRQGGPRAAESNLSEGVTDGSEG
jgi:hypothetical protein